MRFRWCLALLGLLVALGGCGDDDSGSSGAPPGTDYENSGNTSESTPSEEEATPEETTPEEPEPEPEKTGIEALNELIPEGTAQEDISGRLDEILAELAPEEQVAPEPDVEALFESGNTADSAQLQATADYLLATIQHADTIWSNWFQTNGFTEPGVGYQLLQPQETFTTVCDNGLTVDGSYNNAFYCPDDPNDTGVGPTGQDNGMVVLPVDTMRQMWSGDIFDQQVISDVGAVGDFAAGIVTAHEFGHHIADEMAIQTNTSPPGRPNSELIADCFAGVWAYSVFLDNYLEEGDLEEAIAALDVIGDNVGDHGTGTERQNAFLIGYAGTQITPGGGVPQRCIEEYWK